jgi:type IV secretory pathway VirB3-like protein
MPVCSVWKATGLVALSQKMGPVGISIILLGVITFILGIVVIAVSGALMDVVCARCLRLYYLSADFALRLVLRSRS